MVAVIVVNLNVCMFICIHVLQSSSSVCHAIHFAERFANISGSSCPYKGLSTDSIHF